MSLQTVPRTGISAPGATWNCKLCNHCHSRYRAYHFNRRSEKCGRTVLTAGGATNHADAFSKAIQLFDPASSNAKVMVMFTDGKTTAGAPPSPVAAEARAAGIIIYCIGLLGDDGIDVEVLNDWATDPDASHVAVTPDEEELEDLFADLAADISKPGALDIVIDEIVNPDFAIVSIDPPSKGTVR